MLLSLEVQRGIQFILFSKLTLSIIPMNSFVYVLYFPKILIIRALQVLMENLIIIVS